MEVMNRVTRMHVLIIEDEKPAADKLIRGVRKFDRSIIIDGPLQTVREILDWFSANPAPDLIIADIQLTDGQSLEAIRKIKISSPIIFVTAHDEFLLEALEQNGIDYLLKPFRQTDFERTLVKYQSLRNHFTSGLASFLDGYTASSSKWKKRIVVIKGTARVSVRTEEIAYFFTSHKIVFMVDKNGNRHIVDKNLSDLESCFDPNSFFRVNRQFLVNIDAVQRFKLADHGRLILELQPPTSAKIEVSEENARPFKQWLDR